MSHTLSINTIIEGQSFVYKIVRVLGQGTFGITYLCEIVEDGNSTTMLVCLKEFFMGDVNGREGSYVTSGNENGLFDDYRRKFIREANNLSRLRHDNIVKVIELFEANNTVYYSMSFIPGGSLDDLISIKGKLSQSQSLRICCEIADALVAMHAQGMLHLDLKPGNVMMLNGITPILIDFGLSKNYNQDGKPESSTSIGGGTPGYSPMEQSNYSGGNIPVTMDIYALGATLYKMISGVRPPIASDIFNDGFPYDALKASGIDENIIKFIQKAMMPSRKDRFQSMEEMRMAVRGLYDRLTLPHTPVYSEIDEVTPPLPPVFQNKKKHKGRYFVILGAALSIIILFIIAMMSGNSSEEVSVVNDTVNDTVATVKEFSASSVSENKTIHPSESISLKGVMAGFPITLKLKLEGGDVAGTYHNIQYNSTYSVSGSYGEGVYSLILSNRNERLSMVLYDYGDSLRGKCTSGDGRQTLNVNLKYQ